MIVAPVAATVHTPHSPHGTVHTVTPHNGTEHAASVHAMGMGMDGAHTGTVHQAMAMGSGPSSNTAHGPATAHSPTLHAPMVRPSPHLLHLPAPCCCPACAAAASHACCLCVCVCVAQSMGKAVFADQFTVTYLSDCVANDVAGAAIEVGGVTVQVVAGEPNCVDIDADTACVEGVCVDGECVIGESLHPAQHTSHSIDTAASHTHEHDQRHLNPPTPARPHSQRCCCPWAGLGADPTAKCEAAARQHADRSMHWR